MNLHDAEDKIQELRKEFFFGDDEPFKSKVAEIHFLAAIAMLECAQRYMQLAALANRGIHVD